MTQGALSFVSCFGTRNDARRLRPLERLHLVPPVLVTPYATMRELLPLWACAYGCAIYACARDLSRKEVLGSIENSGRAVSLGRTTSPVVHECQTTNRKIMPSLPTWLVAEVATGR